MDLKQRRTGHSRFVRTMLMLTVLSIGLMRLKVIRYVCLCPGRIEIIIIVRTEVVSLGFEGLVLSYRRRIPCRRLRQR